MELKDNYYFYVKAYLRKRGYVLEDCDFLVDRGHGIEIDSSKWPYDIDIPTEVDLLRLSKADVLKEDVKSSSLILDVHTEIPTGVYKQGSLIVVNKESEYALYVFLDNEFRLL